ncbi:hypothetical protein NSK_002563 [Nannochloropsis salina CCMP1776]|uniref:Ribosome recycling factor domain-containing protein n=1 Tax=Nannochloropsis salina CCMP1776 TaxID=1027361 RepID=A0A4D9DA72_9STRA|nr:hypothetical protein NSK_002563 [Nannochloropsis salina CCMP1776]|eukprot:TFJ86355.1 hypothetical protein NSK_002563 [Nannochloropsis salina CCMP1776]
MKASLRVEVFTVYLFVRARLFHLSVVPISINPTQPDRRKGSANAGGSGSGSGTAAPSRHTAPHHHHAPSIGGVTHNEQPLVDLDKLQSKMERVLRGLEKEFSGVRGGRPDAGMFDHLYVQAYGKATPLSDVAQVTIKSPTLAVIHVYDPDILHPVHEAVQASKLELNPRVDGNVVNVPLPKPSAEMRQGYVKLVSQCTETARQNLRKIRREGMDRLKGEGKEGVGEDDVRRSSKLIESMTEEWVKRVGEALEKKKKEIMTV